MWILLVGSFMDHPDNPEITEAHGPFSSQGDAQNFFEHGYFKHKKGYLYHEIVTLHSPGNSHQESFDTEKEADAFILGLNVLADTGIENVKKSIKSDKHVVDFIYFGP